MYKSKNNGKTINFINNGNAANFVYGGVNGHYIYSVQAELLVCSLMLIKEGKKITPKIINVIGESDMNNIAKIWLNTFEEVEIYKEDENQFINNEQINKDVMDKSVAIEMSANNINNDYKNQPCWLPNYSAYFIGRKTSLKFLSNFFEATDNKKPYSQIVIAGMGGFGKTNLALYYGWNQQDKYPGGCFYIDATNKESIELSFKKIAEKLDINVDTINSEKIAQKIYAKQKKYGRILFIFDDAPDKKLLSLYLDKLGLTSSDLAVVITTRNRMFATKNITYMLDEQKSEIEEDGLALLEKVLSEGEKNVSMGKTLDTSIVNETTDSIKKLALSIAEELHYLPLAISQAIAYITNENCAPEQYLKLLQQQAKRKELLEYESKNEIDEQENSNKLAVAKTWALSLEAILKRNSSKQEEIKNTLYTISFLYPEKITDNLFSTNKSFLQLLRDYCLLFPSEDIGVYKVYKIHRLFQEVIRDGLQREVQMEYLKTALTLVNGATSYNRENLEPIKDGILHYNFIDKIITALKVKISTAEYAMMLYKIGVYYQEKYEHETSIIFYEKANTLTSLLDNKYQLKLKKQLAKAYVAIDELNKAENVYEELTCYKIEDKNKILWYKIEIDKYHFLQKKSYTIKNFSLKHKVYTAGARLLKNIINELTPEQPSSNIRDAKERQLLLAQCYHYLGNYYNQKVKGTTSLIKSKKETLDDLEEWQTDVAEDIENEINNLKKQIPISIKKSITCFKEALAIKEKYDSHSEIIRSTVALANVINTRCCTNGYKNTYKNIIEDIIKKNCELYKTHLPHLKRDDNKLQYYGCTLCLAQLLKNYSLMLKKSDLECAEKIIKEEMPKIENDFGGNSNEYKNIEKIYKPRQSILLHHRVSNKKEKNGKAVDENTINMKNTQHNNNKRIFSSMNKNKGDQGKEIEQQKLQPPIKKVKTNENNFILNYVNSSSLNKQNVFLQNSVVPQPSFFSTPQQRNKNSQNQQLSSQCSEMNFVISQKVQK